MTLPPKVVQVPIAGTTSLQPRRHRVRLPPVVSLRDLKKHCRSCSLRELCLPLGMDAEGLRQIEALISTRARLRRGQRLYRVGDVFQALYAVRSGSLKTSILAQDGREHVSGYHMLGDIVGLDGIGAGHHGCQAIALEDTEACVLPFERIEELARAVPQFGRNLYRFLSQEILRDEELLLLLGSGRVEERLAAFLLNLAERYHRGGYSSTEFILRMTQEEIGSHLGMTPETVSRLLSQFRAAGLADVRRRNVKLVNRGALKELARKRVDISGPAKETDS